MMKRILILTTIFTLLTITNAHAQSIQGNVRDPNGVPVPFATITLLTADSTYIDGTTCDDNGHYELATADSAVLAQASCVGYITVTQPIASKDFTLHASEVALDNVEIVNMRQLIKTEADRLTYNLQADPDARTNNLLDMLRKVPMVSVDGEDNVRVSGSTSFKFYKNGHLDPALSSNPREVLRAIPASSIQRIEVITEPGARYDAEGTTAIINIITMPSSHTTGVNGSVSGTVNTFGGYNASASVTGQAGKFTLNATVSYQSNGKRENESVGHDEYIYPQSGVTTRSDMLMRQPARIPTAWLTASYEIDSLNLITASFGGHYYNLDIDGYNIMQYQDAQGDTFASYKSLFSMPKYDGMKWNGRADYEHRTHRPDEVLTFSYMYARSGTTSDERTDFDNLVNPPFDFTGYNAWSKERFTEHTLQVDYQLPLFTHHQLETGAKYIRRLNRSHTAMTYDNAADMNTNNRFNHDTHVGALYASWAYASGPLSMRVGLRYEYSRLNAEYPNGDGTNFHSNLNDWVPSASFNWNINQGNSLRLSYAANINRPGISDLNPAVQRYATSVKYGNAHLGSAHNHNLRLSFQHVGNKFTFKLTPSVSFTHNLIGRLCYAIDNIPYQTYSNDNRYFHAGFSGFAQWAPSATTSLIINGELLYKRYSAPYLNLMGDGVTGNIYAQVSQRLPWKLRASATCIWFYIGHDRGSVYDYFELTRPNIVLSLQRSFLKSKRLTISLRANSILYKNTVYHTVIDQGDYFSTSDMHKLSRNLSITASWRFGNNKVKVKKTATTIENDDLVDDK